MVACVPGAMRRALAASIPDRLARSGIFLFMAVSTKVKSACAEPNGNTRGRPCLVAWLAAASTLSLTNKENSMKISMRTVRLATCISVIALVAGCANMNEMGTGGKTAMGAGAGAAVGAGLGALIGDSSKAAEIGRASCRERG